MKYYLINLYTNEFSLESLPLLTVRYVWRGRYTVYKFYNQTSIFWVAFLLTASLGLSFKILENFFISSEKRLNLVLVYLDKDKQSLNVGVIMLLLLNKFQTVLSRDIFMK